MEETILECKCGFESKNIHQLTKHKAKCKSINTETQDTPDSLIRDSFICIHCKKILASKFSCERHMIICKSRPIDSDENYKNMIKEKFLEFEKNMILIKNYINLLDTSNEREREILLQSDIYKKPLEFLMAHNLNNEQQNITKQNITNNNTTNNTTNNTDSNNITNNTINSNNTTNNITNNNTNISVVYPFGYENIYFLTDVEMIKILTGGNCLIDAMNKIYANTENKNFMKRNVKIENVTIIDKSCYIKVLKDDIFKRKIIKQTFESLKLMFNHCKNKLNIEHQIMLWQNLRILDESIKENITTEKEENMSIEIRQILDNITSMIYEKNECAVSKVKFMEIKNSMINPEFKRVFDEKLNHIVTKMQEFRDDYNNRIIDLEFIMKNIWTRNLENDPQLSITHPDNHIKAHDVVDTPRFKFYEEMAKLENEYLAIEERNTTGNIDSVCDIREQLAEKEYKTYTKKYDLDVKERKTLERKVKTERKYGVRDKMIANQKKILKKIETNSSNVSS